jgi:hypothetical protein
MDLDFSLHDELLHLQEDSIENYSITNEVNLQGRSRQELEVYLNGIPNSLEPVEKITK